ncbi:hypothetical protein [Nitratifractor sp.]|uniref:hypothetical protein n=1 Tax=Nitratifractor sp. TaxID=2268144 RepID=UPI0025E495B0|nr:hypothetical protein [Nitratifractor sp.]
MRLRSRFLSILVNFLLGVAWAIALIGALSAILTYSSFGLLAAALHSMIWATPGLFLVLLLEYLLAGFQRTEELRRQGRVLDELLETLKKDSSSR